MASRVGSERPIRRACTPGSTTRRGYHGDVQNFGHIDDPAFVEIVDSTGAAFVTAIMNFGGGNVTVEIGCNPHAGGEG